MALLGHTRPRSHVSHHSSLFHPPPLKPGHRHLCSSHGWSLGRLISSFLGRDPLQCGFFIYLEIVADCNSAQFIVRINCAAARMVSAAVAGALTAWPTLSWNRSNVTNSAKRASRFRHGIRRVGVCGVQAIRAGVASSPKTGTLQYKKLGDSDLLISEITLGTVSYICLSLSDTALELHIFR